ncbi:MAG: peptidase LD-carboxypeptidase [Clostridiales bacterium]|jgi:muramoyltetrapeptide carboxypeptidase|nr:peptidase LD-carboxypeptidase [Clostridiales bacterium]
MKKPAALRSGDTIGLIGTSSHIGNVEKVKKCEEVLNELGFNVVVGESCYGQYGYLSGPDELRASDVNRMFEDRQIDGIFCIRGGYGTSRILDKLDYEMIKHNPKVFAGYSDITSVHIALNQICKLVTFHGPMPSTDMIPEFDSFSRRSFLRAVTSTESLGVLNNPPNEEIKSLVTGCASGVIVGGNLSLVAATMGTKFEIDTKDKLLFLEDIDEEPYRVDRMLSQLRLGGKLDECSGIILGDWNNCTPKNYNPSLSLIQVFEDIIVPAGKPTIYNFKAGHCSPKITVPFGVKAVLNANECSLALKERGLK